MIEKILIVDDEPRFIRLLDANLVSAGYEVITANNGLEAIDQVVNNSPALILMDVMMPKMDGYVVLERMRAELDPPPLVIMLTAKGQETDVVRGFTIGADDYIIKPFAPRELIARVNVALIKAGKLSANSDTP